MDNIFFKSLLNTEDFQNTLLQSITITCKEIENSKEHKVLNSSVRELDFTEESNVCITQFIVDTLNQYMDEREEIRLTNRLNEKASKKKKNPKKKNLKKGIKKTSMKLRSQKNQSKRKTKK